MFAEYDDTEIGALDCDDIDGYLSATPEVLLKCAEQFADQRRLYKLDEDKDVKKLVYFLVSSQKLLKLLKGGHRNRISKFPDIFWSSIAVFTFTRINNLN